MNFIEIGGMLIFIIEDIYSANYEVKVSSVNKLHIFLKQYITEFYLINTFSELVYKFE